MNDYTRIKFSPKQGRLPVFLEDCLDITDPVLTFDSIMEEIEIEKYLSETVKRHELGRIGYNPVKLLKVILYGFMDKGYISLRELEENCKINLRYMYLMEYERPSYRTFGNFIERYLEGHIEEIFNKINKHIFEEEGVDLTHLYIDGSKFEANANKYSWVWKKGTENARYRLYEKITRLLTEINTEISDTGIRIPVNTEYVPEYLEEIREKYAALADIDTSRFVYGKGHHKSSEQRHFELLTVYIQKLKEYIEKIRICGEGRNSYSKTDTAATFMRIKTDYMGNDQLLPAYNVQFGVADEYIAVMDVNHYRSDMDCFIPLMEKFVTVHTPK